MIKKIILFGLATFSSIIFPCHATNLSSSEVASPSNLDNTKTDWWFIRNKDHVPPNFNTHLPYKLEDYGGICLGDTSRKVIYLTFDEGYENGYTPVILDILKAHNVKAIFFVTSTYITTNPDIISRMALEGHIVGNHTKSHPSMPKVAENEERFNEEINDVAEKYKEVTGQDMPPFFRPPMGHYSQKSLAMTKALGYKTVFWSFAYPDWDVKNQPTNQKAMEMMVGGLHNGGIYLLHAVSKTNTEVLGSFIEEATKMGYSFELLP